MQICSNAVRVGITISRIFVQDLKNEKLVIVGSLPALLFQIYLGIVAEL